ncbi:unnamed protein product [Brassica rapa subsp. narinosa]
MWHEATRASGLGMLLCLLGSPSIPSLLSSLKPMS